MILSPRPVVLKTGSWPDMIVGAWFIVPGIILIFRAHQNNCLLSSEHETEPAETNTYRPQFNYITELLSYISNFYVNMALLDFARLKFNVNFAFS
jgi:hypothetical protein